MSGDMLAMINAIFPFLIMGGVFYFMLWRPQRQERAKRRAMLDGLKVGDKIVTVGGLCGKIVKLEDTKMTLNVAKDVDVVYLRSAVSYVDNGEAPKVED